MSDELTPISERIPNRKHRLFIDELFKQNQNGTKAYQTVYGCSYDTARANAPKLLANTSISEEIERRMQESAMSADEALMRLAAQARGSLGDFFTHYEGINAPFLNLQEADEKGLMPLIKRIEWGDNDKVKKIELYDAQSAIVDILKIHGKFANDPGSSEDKPFIVKVVYANDRTNRQSETTPPETD